MGIKVSDRLRTSRGRYPVNDAFVVSGQDGRKRIEFSFAQEWGEERPIALEDLAGCLRASRDLDPDEICERIALFARKTGPLLGDAADEAVSDWQFAIGAAQEAIRMQEQVNGTRPWVSEAERVVKTTVTDPAGGVLFNCYNYTFGIGPENPGRYSSSIPSAPWVRTFSESRGGDYLFAVRSVEGGIEAFDICLVSCEGSLSLALLAQMLCFFNDQPLTRAALLEMGVGQLDGVDVAEVERMASALENENAVRFAETPVGKADAPHIQRIVQAMAALHLQRVTVDLFKSDDTGDSLAFDTFLSSLWYDFAMQLGAVKVGYCQECGAGFSLTGHRGLPKRYCSDECRTKAKNRRERDKVSRVRAMYMEGHSIPDIARELYAEKSERVAAKDIVSMLAKWPPLKQAIRDECAKKGEHPFARRCCEDGVISERQIELLEKRASRSGRQR
ncbi:MAG: hypothetical protein IJ111_06150 [Eggerthellaceae bacterium]|nr:hypothetical protein [Eggerthellaceae bacterium]